MTIEIGGGGELYDSRKGNPSNLQFKVVCILKIIYIYIFGAIIIKFLVIL